MYLCMHMCVCASHVSVRGRVYVIHTLGIHISKPAPLKIQFKLIQHYRPMTRSAYTTNIANCTQDRRAQPIRRSHSGLSFKITRFQT